MTSESGKIRLINTLLVMACGVVVTYFSRNIMIDDALIYYRYIENFINGNGLVYNIGERFNALSSPLYIYLSILVSSVTREVVITQIVINGILLILSAIVIINIFFMIGRAGAGFAASIMVVTSKYFYSVFGLETNLFILLSLLCIYLFLAKRSALLILFAALLLITRGEGLFLILILGFLNFRKRELKFKAFYFIFPLLIISANVCFNYFYYHEIIPHTLSAKISQGKSGMWMDYISHFAYLGSMFDNSAVLIISLFLLAAFGIYRNFRNTVVVILLSYSILIAAFYALLKIPNYHWYYSIQFLSLYLNAAFGIAELAKWITAKISHTTAAAVICAVILFVPAYRQIQSFEGLRNSMPHTEYKRIGVWMESNTDKDSKIAAVEIGHLGWFSKRYIIDILGLTNSYNAGYVAEGKMDMWYEHDKPDYIVVHVPVWKQEELVPKLLANGVFETVDVADIKGFTILKKTAVRK